jgi:acyl dehydratase
MDESVKGKVLFEVEEVLSSRQMETLAAAIGSSTSKETASLVPYFGPAIAGERALVDALNIDLRKALLGTQSYEWARPFQPGERVRIRVCVDDAYTKGNLRFAVVVSEFKDEQSELICRQRTVFIERGD